MKHIAFDESTVLGEYARIANEKGIIKEAAEVPATPKPAAPAVTRASITKDIVTKFSALRKDLLGRIQEPRMKAEVSSKFMAAAGKLRGYLGDAAPIGGSLDAKPPGIGGMSLQKTVDPNQQFIATVAGVVRQLKGELQSVLSASKAYAVLSMSLNSLDEIPQSVQEAVMKATKTSPIGEMFGGKNPMIGGDPGSVSEIGEGIQAPQQSEDGVSVTASLEKEAEGQSLYDITGETGEQLIDSAHPGGGTRTELSVKTDENLVETIVEQQEKDLEVARSVPKGTYAALVKLHNQLSKMGHGNKLSSLRKTIMRIATTEDIVRGALIGLSDKLDKMGLEEFADRIDSISKYAGMFEWWTNYNPLEALRNRLEDIDKSDEPPLNQWIPILNGWQQKLSSFQDEAQRAQFANQVAQQLNKLQQLYGGMKNRGEISEWGADDAEFEKQLANTITTLQQGAAKSQQVAQQQQKGKAQQNPLDRIMNPKDPMYKAIVKLMSDAGGIKGVKDDDLIATYVQFIGTAPDKNTLQKIRGIMSGASGTATKTKPKGGNVFNNYGLAMKWSKRFNGVISKIDPNSKIDELAQMHVRTGDAEARRNQQVSGALRKSLIRAIRVWRKAGKSFKSLEKYLRETYGDQLAKEYPGANAEKAHEVSGEQYTAAVNATSKQLVNMADETMADWVPGFNRTKLSIRARRYIRSVLGKMSQRMIHESFPAEAFPPGRELKLSPEQMDGILERMSEDVKQKFTDSAMKALEAMR